jgi:hypothetical protein
MAVKNKICAGWVKIRQKGYTRGKYWQSGEGGANVFSFSGRETVGMVYISLSIYIYKTNINYQIGKKNPLCIKKWKIENSASIKWKN